MCRNWQRQVCCHLVIPAQAAIQGYFNVLCDWMPPHQDAGQALQVQLDMQK